MALDPTIIKALIPTLSVAAAFGGAGLLTKVAGRNESITSFGANLPWTRPMSDDETIACDGEQLYFRVLKITGAIYSSMRDSEINDLERRKQAWIMSVRNDDIDIREFTRHTSANFRKRNHANTAVGAMNAKWDDHMDKSKMTDHHIIVLVKGKNNIARMDAAIQTGRSILSELEPVVLNNRDVGDLGNSELMSYLHYLLNFQEFPVPPLYKNIAFELSASHYVRRKDGIIVTHGYGKKTYHAVVGVRAYGSRTHRDVINILLGENFSFDLLVRMHPLSTHKSEQRIAFRSGQANINFFNQIMTSEDARKEKEGKKVGNDDVNSEWQSIKNAIKAEKETITEVEFFVYPRADTVEELKEIVERVCERLGMKGFQAKQEVPLAWFAFNARLPGFQKWVRKRDLLATNASEMIPFSTSPKGNTKSVWGPTCLRYMPTAGDNASYPITIQPGPSDEDSPHWLIFAGTGKGKTVLLNFLLSGALDAYPELRAVMLDYRQGMRVFNAFHHGSYLFPGEETLQLNPFDVDDTAQNRVMVHELLSLMAGATGDEDLKKLDGAVIDIFKMDRDNRFLGEKLWKGCIPAGSLRDSLRKWVESERYKGHLTGLRDTFDPNQSRLLTIAMDAVIEDPLLSSVLSFYFMKRIETEFVQRGLPYVFVVDEAPTLLADANLVELVSNYLRTARKNHGAVLSVWQEVDTLLTSPLGPTMLKNCKNALFWPGTADSVEDLAHFPMTETLQQFVIGNFTPPNSKRPVLLYRRDGESVILESDLLVLGEHLKILQGSLSMSKRLLKCQEEYPGAWETRYLYS